MSNDTPPPIDRARVRSLYIALLGGLCVVCTAFGSLFWLGRAPMLPAEERQLIAVVLSIVAGGVLLLAWFWARPQVPLREAKKSVEAFWSDPNSGGKALLLWVLGEGGAMIGAVATLLTGSLLPASVGLLGLATLILNGPGFLERRES